MKQACFALLLSSALGAALASDEQDAPRNLGIQKETESRLVMLDVTVRGPADTLEQLSPEDFELFVGPKSIKKFSLDRTCAAPNATAVEAVDAPVEEFVAQSSGATYLFYFDQLHLTGNGRLRSLELSRELIPRLITGHSRAMVVSSGRDLRTLAPLTSDHATLLDALDRLEQDPTQWHELPSQEDGRVQRVLTELDRVNADYNRATARDSRAVGEHQRKNLAPKAHPLSGGISGESSRQRRNAAEAAERVGWTGLGLAAQARTLAVGFQREERDHTRRALERLSMALDTLEERPLPKAVIYFADTMRANAGDHYLRLVPAGGGDLDQTTMTGTLPSYDDVIEMAAAHGVRLYTVEAKGLSAELPIGGASIGNRFAGADTSTLTTKRFDDARDGLVGFALETGGRPFLLGADTDLMVDQIGADLACPFVISFDPAGLKEDRRLPIRVEVNEPGVQVQSRTLLIVRSESSRLASQLARAFTTPEDIESDIPVHGVVIPTGFKKGKYSALVQVAVLGQPLSDTVWDIGVSLLVGGAIKEQASGRFSVHSPGVPIIFETEMSFPPGPYELSAVAHESKSGQVSAARFNGEWPDPSDGTVVVGPIALLQPTVGAFVRSEQLRKSGSLGHATQDAVRVDLPTALVGLVCRAKGHRKPLYVERHLVGETSAPFDTLDLATADSRCAVFSDVIPAGTMTAGVFHYEVTVVDESDDRVARADREFAVVALAD